eukprot:2670522-Pleurochrysis_carterae.AAC.1
MKSSAIHPRQETVMQQIAVTLGATIFAMARTVRNAAIRPTVRLAISSLWPMLREDDARIVRSCVKSMRRCE